MNKEGECGSSVLIKALCEKLKGAAKRGGERPIRLTCDRVTRPSSVTPNTPGVPRAREAEGGRKTEMGKPT